MSIFVQSDPQSLSPKESNALSVTFDFFGESDWGSDWTKMDNVTLYYSVIILYNLLAKPNFLKWDDKE